MAMKMGMQKPAGQVAERAGRSKWVISRSRRVGRLYSHLRSGRKGRLNFPHVDCVLSNDLIFFR